MPLPIIAAIIPILGSLLDKVIPDTEARDKAKQELTTQLMLHSTEMDKAATDIILAEAKSSNKLASSWRPILMYVFVAIIANNFLLAPYVNAFFGNAVILDMPKELWTLLTVGVGGYVPCRTAEKVIKEYVKGKKN